MKTCDHCGGELPEELHFCLHCMTRLEAAVPVEAAPGRGPGRVGRPAAMACCAVAAALVCLLWLSPRPAAGPVLAGADGEETGPLAAEPVEPEAPRQDTELVDPDSGEAPRSPAGQAAADGTADAAGITPTTAVLAGVSTGEAEPHQFREIASGAEGEREAPVDSQDDTEAPDSGGETGDAIVSRTTPDGGVVVGLEDTEEWSAVATASVVTRETMADLLGRMARQNGKEGELYLLSAAAEPVYSSSTLIWAVHAGIFTMGEDGTYAPQAATTLEEALNAVYRFSAYMGDPVSIDEMVVAIFSIFGDEAMSFSVGQEGVDIKSNNRPVTGCEVTVLISRFFSDLLPGVWAGE